MPDNFSRQKTQTSIAWNGKADEVYLTSAEEKWPIEVRPANEYLLQAVFGKAVGAALLGGRWRDFPPYMR